MNTTNAAASGAAQPGRAQMDPRMPSAAAEGVPPPATQGGDVSGSAQPPRTAGSKSSDDMNARLSELIQAQVDSGTLSADQASELQDFFTQPPSAGDASTKPAAAAPSHSGAPISEAASMKLDALEKFLGRLRENSGVAMNGYGSNSGGGAVTTGLVLDSLS